MAHIYDLAGSWKFTLDPASEGVQLFNTKAYWTDTIELPGTTAIGKKGTINEAREIGYLTELYPYEGNAWYQQEVTISSSEVGNPIFLYLERTRITHVWINGEYVSTCDSLCSPHKYDITNYIKIPTIQITILVNNRDYKTKGGHLTSPDTQTNWNGITGRIELQVLNKTYINEMKTYPCIDTNSVTIQMSIIHKEENNTSTILSYYGDLISIDKIKHDALALMEQEVFLSPGRNDIEYTYKICENIEYWSEYNPTLYKLYVHINEKDAEDLSPVKESFNEHESLNNQMLNSKKDRITDAHTTFGLRKFSTDNHYFYINNQKTFLRGKHDGLIFPLTGAAPTTVDEWIKVMQISKNYGINHYRFHTCCPPEAAFTAADLLGIYMQPELPFWGTVTTIEDDGHNENEFQFLCDEGERILKSYGNHPSFVMMSLGNELWGSKEKLAEILRSYRALDERHLYTQGCNNFQWVPVILNEDDFFVGVRFTLERQIRGSYAACDKPFGFVQSQQPNTNYDYDKNILPNSAESHVGEDSIDNADNLSLNKKISNEIDIQYGTGTKRVTAENTQELIPSKPVISHEIGQYATFPNFKEIHKYVGVLRARNFEVFKERLDKAGMLSQADDFFNYSGKLAVQCYKLELEAAHRSNYLAGYQILDLQDFSGQGTALVGILDAFMDSKELITQKEWRRFCSDAVILAKFDHFNYVSMETLNFELLLSDYRPFHKVKQRISWQLTLDNGTVISSSTLEAETTCAVNFLGLVSISLPKVDQPSKMLLKLTATPMLPDVMNTSSQFFRFTNPLTIDNEYEFWIYPSNADSQIQESLPALKDIFHLNSRNEETWPLTIVHTLAQAKPLLENHQRVLLIPEHIISGLEGFYSTDFWCYPMFRSISESIKKTIPVGTMGLCIKSDHPALKEFPCESYSTPQWYEIITASNLAILDNLNTELQPIVQMIDNFERNHKLGLLFEANVLGGSLLVCTSKLPQVFSYPEVRQFAISIIHYACSKEFSPTVTVDYDQLSAIIK